MSLKAQNISFEHFSLENGLSDNSIFHITQDKEGYMWFATANGVNKFDGNKFTVFKNDDTKNSIQNNQVRKLYFDSKNTLWCCTNQGISSYNISSETWTNYSAGLSDKNERIRDLIEIGQDTFLVGTSHGLHIFSINTGFPLINLEDTLSVNTTVLINNKILVGTTNGVYYYNKETQSCKLINKSLIGHQVNTIIQSQNSANKIWIGFENTGLMLYDLETDEYKHYTPTKDTPNTISSNTVRSLCYDNNYQLWIGTFEGLNILNEKNGKIETLKNTSYYNNGISQNSIRSIYKDFQGGMWCGTYYGGINYYHRNRKQFEHYKHQQRDNALNDNVINALMEDHQNNIWIGTNDNGINILDPHRKVISHISYKKNGLNGLTGNNIKSIIQHPQTKDIWIGIHHGGLCRVNYSTNKIDRINFTSTYGNDFVYNLLFLDESNLLIGTLNGLFIYNTKTKKRASFPNKEVEAAFAKKSIFSLYADSENGIWIGTNDGYFRYNKTTWEIDESVLKTTDHLKEEETFVFYEDQNKNIWIGTQSGLACYSLRGQKNKDISSINFPKLAIYGILNDAFKKLWISTNDGLFCVDNTVVRRYNSTDGIQSNKFNPNSFCKTKQGKLYFGGINGLNAFTPEQLVENPYTPKAIIQNISVFNKRVTPKDDTNILPERRVGDVKKIEIPSKYTQFGIEFVAINFLSGIDNNNFQYKLEGFDKEWYHTDKTEVNYSNLKPGTYTFMVKAANNAGRWNNKPTKLTIEILPKWYQTWYVKLLALLLVILITIFSFRFYMSRELIRQELEFERKDKERIKDLEQDKIRFFINLSHELRTPLSLILSPVEEALNRGVSDKWLKKQLSSIQYNTMRLLHLANQVLDYRRAEMGAIKLQVKLVEIQPLIEQIYYSFNNLAQSKEINYTLEIKSDNDKCYIDTNYIERIVINLISNALKFTPNKGSVKVTLISQFEWVKIIVSDTGCGIPIELQGKVFDRFYQVEQNMNGTGIGLSFVRKLVELHHGKITLHSAENKGATFEVILPASKEKYSIEEIADNKATFVTNLINSTKTEISILENAYGEAEEKNTEEEESSAKEIKTILIVEDDTQIRNYLIENFSKEYKIISATNGAEAWDIIESKTDIDLIISDIMMPVMDGVTLCKKLKQNIYYCHTPIILLTAKTDIEDQLKGLKTGADDYISKPFVLSILQSKVNNIISQKNRIIKHYQGNIEVNPVSITTNTLDEEMLDKARKIILAQMADESFTVEELSREMGMSRSNLHIKFKAVTGESAIEYIRRIRFSEACRLLQEGRMNMAEISTYIGLTPSYFTTSFKKHMGCLPTEYIEKQKENKN